VVHVDAAEAFGCCHLLREQTGLGLGGSSGAVLAAYLRFAREHEPIGQSVLICPDGADRYEQEGLYSSKFLTERQINIASAMPSVRFELCEEA
jgi:cysteine synthase A